MTECLKHNINQNNTCIDCGLVSNEPIFSNKIPYSNFRVKKVSKKHIELIDNKLFNEHHKTRYDYSFRLAKNLVRDICNKFNIPFLSKMLVCRNINYIRKKFENRMFIFPDWFIKSKKRHIYTTYLAFDIADIYSKPYRIYRYPKRNQVRRDYHENALTKKKLYIYFGFKSRLKGNNQRLSHFRRLFTLKKIIFPNYGVKTL